MQIARSWRQQTSNLRLVGSTCNSCEAKHFPSRMRCPECKGEDPAEFTFGGTGTVFSFTTVYEAPKGFDEQVPYLAALVELEEGPFVTAMLTDVDPEETRVGMKVSMVTRRICAHGETGPIVYAYKFSPI